MGVALALRQYFTGKTPAPHVLETGTVPVRFALFADSSFVAAYSQSSA